MSKCEACPLVEECKASAIATINEAIVIQDKMVDRDSQVEADIVRLRSLPDTEIQTARLRARGDVEALSSQQAIESQANLFTIFATASGFVRQNCPGGPIVRHGVRRCVSANASIVQEVLDVTPKPRSL